MLQPVTLITCLSTVALGEASSEHSLSCLNGQILQAATVSSPPPPPPTGGYAGFQEQMYLNNGNTGQCECCYPTWASSTPNYTFLIPYLNATSMPNLWSDNGTYQYWGAKLFSYLHATVAQDYAFQMQVDSAARLWVNSTLIINATCAQNATQSTINSSYLWSGSINLTIGYYNLTIEYHNGNGNGTFIVRSGYAGLATQVSLCCYACDVILVL
ncbi:hypothetical protein WJX82_008016 [Trebouxia sp. C0006]